VAEHDDRRLTGNAINGALTNRKITALTANADGTMTVTYNGADGTALNATSSSASATRSPTCRASGSKWRA
jgi:hypothetical protein